MQRVAFEELGKHQESGHISSYAHLIESQFHENRTYYPKPNSNVARGLEQHSATGQQNKALKLLLNSLITQNREKAHSLNQLETRLVSLVDASSKDLGSQHALDNLQNALTYTEHSIENEIDNNTYLKSLFQRLNKEYHMSLAQNEGLKALNKRQDHLVSRVGLCQEISKKQTNFTLNAKLTRSHWFTREKSEVNDLIRQASQSSLTQRQHVQSLQLEQAKVRYQIEVAIFITQQSQDNQQYKKQLDEQIEALSKQSDTLKSNLAQSSETYLICQVLSSLKQFFVDKIPTQLESPRAPKDRQSIIQEISKFYRVFSTKDIISLLMHEFNSMKTTLQSLEQRYQQLTTEREALVEETMHLDELIQSYFGMDLSEDSDDQYTSDIDFKQLCDQVEQLELRVNHYDNLALTIFFKQKIQLKRFQSILTKFQDITQSSDSLVQDLLYKIQINGSQLKILLHRDEPTQQQPKSMRSVTRSQQSQVDNKMTDSNNSLSSDVSILEKTDRLGGGRRHVTTRQLKLALDHYLPTMYRQQQLAKYLINKDVIFQLLGTEVDLMEFLTVSKEIQLSDAFHTVKSRLTLKILSDIETCFLLEQDFIQGLSQQYRYRTKPLNESQRMSAFGSYRSLNFQNRASKLFEQKAQTKKETKQKGVHDLRVSVLMIEALSRRKQSTKNSQATLSQDVPTENEDVFIENERMKGKSQTPSLDLTQKARKPGWNNYINVEKNHALSELIQTYQVISNLQKLQRAEPKILDEPTPLLSRGLLTARTTPKRSSEIRHSKFHSHRSTEAKSNPTVKRNSPLKLRVQVLSHRSQIVQNYSDMGQRFDVPSVLGHQVGEVSLIPPRQSLPILTATRGIDNEFLPPWDSNFELMKYVLDR